MLCVFGVFGYLFFFYTNFPETAIVDESQNIIGRYSVIISCLSVSTLFLVLGVMGIFRVVGFSFISSTDKDKNIINVVSGLFYIPFIVSFSLVIFELSDNYFKIGLWLLLVLYCVVSLFNSVIFLFKAK